MQHRSRSRSPSTAGCLVLGFVLALILAFVPFPGSTLRRAAHRHVHRAADLPGDAGLHVPLRLGRHAQRSADAHRFGCSVPPVDFLYSAWGVILAEVTVFTPFVLRPLLAAFSLVDHGQIEVAEHASARGPGGSCARSSCPPRFPALHRRRQPLPAAHRQRVRHRAVHRRQGRHHAAAADLRQGDPGIGLQGRLHHRRGQHRAVARPLLALSLRRSARFGGRRCWSGLRSGRVSSWALLALC